MGLVGEDLGKDIDQCFTEASPIAKEIEDAIDMFEKGGIMNIADGMIKMFQVVKEIPIVFEDCEHISKSALDKLLNFTDRFNDPEVLLMKLSRNMLFHGSEIIGYVDKSVESFDSGNAYDAGLNAGLAINKATA